MKVSQLKIQGLRNLSNIHIYPNPNFNLFYGVNGSGKTSLLESLYLLGFGRSFRSPHLNTLIHHEAESLTTYTQVINPQGQDRAFGFEKNRQGRLKLKVDGQIISGISQVAEHFPVQILCPDSFQLLTSGPQERRQFLDWGVFHVEPSFFAAWVNYSRALRQRNSLLRQRSFVLSELMVWDEELIKWGAILTDYRQLYVADLILGLKRTLETLLPLIPIDINYYQGWEEGSFREALIASRAVDLKLGFTRVGPQRADVIIKIEGILAGQILSRGQQKLCICALILAQGALILEKVGKNCIYLVDDLSAELDSGTRRRVIEHLAAAGSQVFITGIEKDFLKSGIAGFEHQMFHVEHGCVF